MADKKPQGKPAAKPAAGAKKKPGIKRWTQYIVSGDKLERKLKSCPKCGPGTYMAEHKNRRTCGTCKYTEFKAK